MSQFKPIEPIKKLASELFVDESTLLSYVKNYGVYTCDVYESRKIRYICRQALLLLIDWYATYETKEDIESPLEYVLDLYTKEIEKLGLEADLSPEKIAIFGIGLAKATTITIEAENKVYERTGNAKSRKHLVLIFQSHKKQQCLLKFITKVNEHDEIEMNAHLENKYLNKYFNTPEYSLEEFQHDIKIRKQDYIPCQIEQYDKQKHNANNIPEEQKINNYNHHGVICNDPSINQPVTVTKQRGVPKECQPQNEDVRQDIMHNATAVTIMYHRNFPQMGEPIITQKGNRPTYNQTPPKYNENTNNGNIKEQNNLVHSNNDSDSGINAAAPIPPVRTPAPPIKPLNGQYAVKQHNDQFAKRYPCAICGKEHYEEESAKQNVHRFNGVGPHWAPREEVINFMNMLATQKRDYTQLKCKICKELFCIKGISFEIDELKKAEDYFLADRYSLKSNGLVLDPDPVSNVKDKTAYSYECVFSKFPYRYISQDLVAAICPSKHRCTLKRLIEYITNQKSQGIPNNNIKCPKCMIPIDFQSFFLLAYPEIKALLS